MLILTRRVGETLMIGDEVSVTVLGVKGNQVRLGVNAPKDIAVHREEIYQRILHEKDPTANFQSPSTSQAGYGDDNFDAGFDKSGFDKSGFGAGHTERNDRRYPRANQFGTASSHTTRYRNGSNDSYRTGERSGNGGMNHLENRGFGGTTAGNNFNPSFDPFDEDYYNR